MIRGAHPTSQHSPQGKEEKSVANTEFSWYGQQHSELTQLAGNALTWLEPNLNAGFSNSEQSFWDLSEGYIHFCFKIQWVPLQKTLTAASMHAS